MDKYFMHVKERNHAKLKNMLQILAIKCKSKNFPSAYNDSYT